MRKKSVKVTILAGVLSFSSIGSSDFTCQAMNRNVLRVEATTLANDVAKEVTEGTYTWKEISVTIPDSWKGKYEIIESENGFKFIQKTSKEKDKDLGFICGFYKADNNILEFTGQKMLAYTDDTMYYSSNPTDVCCYQEDKKIVNEYISMINDVATIEKSLKIDKENVRYDANEYVLPMSRTIKLSEDDLSNYSDNELMIAKNEIYARHGKQFKNEYLKQHFAKCTWYTPGKYDETTLTKVEKDNIKIISAVEKAYQKENPYPKKLKFKKTYKLNLTGAKNGKKQKLSVSVKKDKKTEDYNVQVTIDKKKFKLADYKVYFAAMEEACYYVTDISTYEPGLEIAFLDYGPSDDLVTHFFSYVKGKLKYIGSVGGFPFKDYTGYNGFENGSLVRSMFRADLINTCYAYSYYRYDYYKKKLVPISYDMYEMQGEEHKLLCDLPVYDTKSTKAHKTTMKAQKQVFFVETDGKQWIKVRAKDGTEGYIKVKNNKITNLDKKASKVFSDLAFFD